MSFRRAYLIFLCSLVLFERQIEGPIFPPQQPKLEGDPCGDDKAAATGASSSSQPPERPVYTAEQIKDHANYLFFEGNFEEAINCFTKAITLDSKVAKYYRNRGLTYTRLNNAASAIEDYQTALVLEPTSVRGLVHMSRQLLYIDRFDEAMEHIEKALDYGENHNTPRISGDERYQVVNLRDRIRSKIKEKEKLHEKVLYKYLKNCIIDDPDKLSASGLTRAEYLDQLRAAFPGVDEEEPSTLARDIPEYFCDKISYDIMRDPVVTPSGITYEKSQIMKHLQDHKTDPMSRTELLPEQLRRNKALKEAIDDFLRMRGMDLSEGEGSGE